MLLKGGFNLTKWVSTNEIFLTAVPAEHRALSPADIPHAEQRILGIPWTLQNDTVSANVSKLSELKELPPTQRTSLRIISSQFDPNKNNCTYRNSLANHSTVTLEKKL